MLNSRILMQESEYQWKSHDGLGYYAWSARPEGKARAVVALVHGIGEHSRRYLPWASLLTENRYAFVSMDYRGHGRSEGKKGYIPSYAALMQDLSLLCSRTCELYPGIPLVLYGHSLGGNLVLNFVLENPGICDLLVVTGPWLRLPFELPGAVKMLGRTLRKLAPGFTQGSKLDTLALSRDPEIVKAYSADPLVHDRISLNLLFSAIDKGEEILLKASSLSLPVLLMHGEEDRITSCPASRELTAGNPSMIELVTWPGCYHELHNEPCREKVFSRLTRWLDQHLPKAD